MKFKKNSERFVFPKYCPRCNAKTENEEIMVELWTLPPYTTLAYYCTVCWEKIERLNKIPPEKIWEHRIVENNSNEMFELKSKINEILEYLYLKNI